MAKPDIEVLDNRMKWGLLITSVVALGLLTLAALKENVFPEWRQYRQQYSSILAEKAGSEREQAIADQFEVGIDHNVLPELNSIDRCITCHTGLDDPRMTEEEHPFRTHPGRILGSHPPERFGCTICHQGQGRATETADAHGRVPHWEFPMLDKKFLYAGCRQCHDESDLLGPAALFAKSAGAVEIPEAAQRLAEGKRLVETKGCLGCHKLDGRGGILGPDITFVGDKTIHGFDFSHMGKDEPREVAYWLKKHFLEPTVISPTTTMPDMGFTEEEAETLTAYVLSLKHREVPASYRPPRSVASMTPEEPDGAELYAMLCSSCHGEDGAASEVPGIRTPALNNRDSLAVADDDYYRFIISHGRSNSTMPAWGPDSDNLPKAQIDKLVAYLREWEGAGAPLSEVSARRGNADIGRSYYNGLCRNCHGNQGAGGIGNALNSSTFLAIASDQFLAETIVNGRPGTAMASWKHLSAQAVSDVLAYLRSWENEPVTFEAVRKSRRARSYPAGVAAGGVLYNGNCAGCHGRRGEGGIGLTLNTSDLLAVVNDEYLYRAIVEGRSTTAMPAWANLSAEQVSDIILYLRSWRREPRRAMRRMPDHGDYALGEVHYRVSCLPCHGEEARGGVGPQLANPSFLNAASNEYLYHWIGEGRVGTAMKGFLAEGQGPTTLRPSQIMDVIAYLRFLGTRDERPIMRTGIGDARLGHELYTGSCAGCHGAEGQGASGPQLNNPTFLRSASDGFLAATMVLGRRGTAMRSMIHGQPGIGQLKPAQVQDIIAHLRSWDVPTTWRRPRAIAEMSKRAIESGEQKFANYCAGCHGPGGKGVQDGPDHFAPALNNKEFLEAASDGFLLATIARGRSNTPMRPFGIGAGGIAGLESEEISDIVSFIRTWQEQPAPEGDL
jgi:mono/diheme cytochrome c family protein